MNFFKWHYILAIHLGNYTIIIEFGLREDGKDEDKIE